MAKAQARRARIGSARKKQKLDPHDLALWRDVGGIFLICVGLLLLAGLLHGSVGPFGDGLLMLISQVFGVGRVLFAVALILLGIMALIGGKSKTRSLSLSGWSLLLCGSITLIHMKAFPLGWEGTFQPGEGGGLLGAILSQNLRAGVGVQGGYVVAWSVIAIAILLVLDATVLMILERVKTSRGMALVKSAAGAVGKLKGTGESGKFRSKEEARAINPLLAKVAERKKARTVGDEFEEVELVRGPKRQEEQRERKPLVEAAEPKPIKPAQNLIELAQAEEEERGRPFVLPPLTLLQEPIAGPQKRSEEETKENIQILEETLESFQITARVVEVAHGPTVTRYEVQLAPGIKVSKIVDLADNLAMSLAAIDVRVEAPIPGKSAIGIEVPNRKRTMVTLRETLETNEWAHHPSKLLVALGKDVAGAPRYADLAKMPHLLIGGATNTGKSVCLSGIISSLLFRCTPSELKLLLIDPKRVELVIFEGIPHLITPVVRHVKQASAALTWAVKEMERRYDVFSSSVVRNIEGYNAKQTDPKEKIPYLIIVIDELADLMLQAGPEVETSITRLAQLARATGIHLVIATQRPSVNVITGTIKANISSRIAFSVTSAIDSRTILDGGGAERLIGNGDMLFMPIDATKPVRIQGALITEKETAAVTEYLKGQARPHYDDLVISGPQEGHEGGSVEDDLFGPAVMLVASTGYASTSMIQRKFKIGYTRAARLVDMMEERNIVGPPDGSKPRQVLISYDEADALYS